MTTEIMKLHVGDLHCKHIIFGGSADNGYARMLGPYAGNNSTRKRITMLEGPPFALELSRLKLKFRTASFPDVFRNTKLSPGSGSFSTSASDGTNSKAPSWASTVAPGTAAQPHSPRDERPLITDEYDERDVIHRNIRGQRIDTPILDPPNKFNPSIINSVKTRKYCNNYHLLGECFHCSKDECKHEHGEKLSGMNLKTLRHIARSTPCRAGFDCEDTNCYWGHHCGRDMCRVTDCRFPPQKHNIDTTIVN